MNRLNYRKVLTREQYQLIINKSNNFVNFYVKLNNGEKFNGQNKPYVRTYDSYK